jgi:putative ABC transport system permease protein
MDTDGPAQLAERVAMARAVVHEMVVAARALRRRPGFLVFAVSTLAAGIGGAALVFSLVHAVLLDALPLRNPDELVWMYNARTERDRAPFSIPDLDDYRRANTTLADFALFTNWTANLTGGGAPERLEGTRVSGNFFPVLGARPLIGRGLSPSDDAGGARVAVITYGLWQRRFGGDAAIVGRSVSLNGAAHTVVGVMPRSFLFPFRDAEVAVPLPLQSDARRGNRGANFLRVVARLKPGVALAQAKVDLDGIARRLQARFPDDDSRKIGVNLFPLHAEIVRDYRQILWTVFAGVGLFLLVGCGNLASLLLARATEREAEFAVRASLGASRARIVRQLAAEASVIAMSGAAAGAALAWVGTRAWRVFGPVSFPHRDTIAVNGPVLAFAVIASLAVTILCGLVPAWRAGRIAAAPIERAARSTTAGPRHQRTRRAFVLLQVAGAVVLLVYMALSARSFARLSRVDVGFDPSHAVSMQLSLPPLDYTDRASLVRFSESLGGRLASAPGVRAVGAVSLRPLTGLLNTIDLAFPGRPLPPPDAVPQAHFRMATPGYFAAAGIPLLAGREFTDLDREDGRPVAIVSRTFAARHWPGQAALGKTVQIVDGSPSAPLTVVGISADVKQFTVDAPATPDLYVPLAQMPPGQAPIVASRMYWMVRADGNLDALGTSVRDAVRAVDSTVAASGIEPLDAVVASSLGGWRVHVRLLEAFGQLAAVLCAIGVYALVSYSARARRREFAIRAACGATTSDVVALVLRSELAPVGMGIATGLLTALVAAPRLPVLFETSPFDGLSYSLAVGGLATVAILATLVPAWRASAADPAGLLHE